MNNPWNIQQKFELPIHVKENVLNWTIQLKKIKQNLRKEWIKNNPLDKNILKELQQIYDSGYGYKNIAKSLGISYTQCRRLFSHLQINVSIILAFSLDLIAFVISENSNLSLSSSYVTAFIELSSFFHFSTNSVIVISPLSVIILLSPEIQGFVEIVLNPYLL